MRMAFTLCILTSGCLLLNSSATTDSSTFPQYMASVSSLSCPPPILSRNTDTGLPNGDTPAMAAMSLPPMPSLLYLSHSSLLSPFVETRFFAFNYAPFLQPSFDPLLNQPKLEQASFHLTQPHNHVMVRHGIQKIQSVINTVIGQQTVTIGQQLNKCSIFFR